MAFLIHKVNQEIISKKESSKFLIHSLGKKIHGNNESWQMFGV